MSTRLSLIIATIFSLLQGTFLPSVLIEGFLVIFLVLTKQYKSASLAIFIIGIIFDLIQNQQLGVTSLLLLVTGGVIAYFANVFPINTTPVLAFLVTIINTSRHYLLFKSFNLGETLILFVVCLLVFWLFSRTSIYTLLPSRSGTRIRIG